jgi:hypothetical protein
MISGGTIHGIFSGLNGSPQLFFSKNIFQAELDQTRSHRGLCDDAEGGRPKSCAGISELRVVEGVVELRAESQLGVFAQAADGGHFADGDIRIELSRSVDNALTGVPITRRSVGTNGGRTADSRRINPITQARACAAGGHEIFVRRAWAECDRGGCGETINGTALRSVRDTGSPPCTMTIPEMDQPLNMAPSNPFARKLGTS